MLLLTLLLIVLLSSLYAFAPVWFGSTQQAALSDSDEEQITSNNLRESLSDLQLDYALEKISAEDFDDQKQSLESELNAHSSD